MVILQKSNADSTTHEITVHESISCWVESLFLSIQNGKPELAGRLAQNLAMHPERVFETPDRQTDVHNQRLSDFRQAPCVFGQPEMSLA